MRHIFIILIMSVLLLSSPAEAQSKKELAAQNAALAQRLSTLEKRMLTGDPAAERLIQRLDGLETSQRNLTGEIERLRFERDNLRNEVTALIEDVAAMQTLSNRIKVHLDAVDLVASEQAQTPQPFMSSQPRTYGDTNAPITQENNFNADSGLVGSEAGPTNLTQVPNAPTFKEATIPVQRDYNEIASLPEEGRRKLSEGDFLGAQSSFRQYLDFNPDAEDAGDVNFWLAETYSVRGGYADAADHYIKSMRKAPDGAKGPDAMVGLAASLRALGKTAEACQALSSFPSQYPNAPQRVRDKARLEAARTGC